MDGAVPPIVFGVAGTLAELGEGPIEAPDGLSLLLVPRRDRHPLGRAPHGAAAGGDAPGVGEALEPEEAQAVGGAVGSVVRSAVRFPDVEEEPRLERIGPAPARVDVHGERVAEGIRVAVDHVSRPVRRIVEARVVVADGEGRVGVRVQVRLHAPGGRRLPVLVVEGEDPVRRAPPEREGIGESAAAA